MAKAILKLKRPITEFEVDIEENSLEVIGYTPTVEPKHGYWVYVGHGWAGEGIHKCSICGHQTPDDGNYCSNCGARMENANE